MFRSIAKSIVAMKRSPPPIQHTAHPHTKAQASRHHLFEEQRQRANEELFDLAMGYLWSTGDMSLGDYYEFGICGSGQFRTALRYAHKWGLDEMRFYAFDSFAGLPATGHLTMTQENFWETVRGQGIFADKVETVKGFYEKTLTSNLQKKFLERKRPAVLVNVDCDLHESAVHVFDFIEPLIQPGTVVYVDDFYAAFVCGRREIHGGTWGTARAFFNFAAKSRLKFYPFTNAGYWGRAFMAYDPAIESAPVI